MFKARVAMFVLALVGVLALGTVTWAADVEGKIKSVDPSGSVVTLEDGTKLTIPPAAKVDKAALKPGATVKASFEDRAGEKVVTTIQVAPAK